MAAVPFDSTTSPPAHPYCVSPPQLDQKITEKRLSRWHSSISVYDLDNIILNASPNDIDCFFETYYSASKDEYVYKVESLYNDDFFWVTKTNCIVLDDHLSFNKTVSQACPDPSFEQNSPLCVLQVTRYRRSDSEWVDVVVRDDKDLSIFYAIRTTSQKLFDVDPVPSKILAFGSIDESLKAFVPRDLETLVKKATFYPSPSMDKFFGIW